ncbi:MAG TPA: type II toxin-antitoxin system VapB family antitoxin [Mycobacterium sp.]|nr:type II toxin-antitoxin system VapB family antitoxin [Mycobacterium sp.]HTX98343.1 type II toxin-antitoxin system VapB family antitoxin [Mycobacterium sp.]
MKKKVELEIDTELLDEAIRRFHLADAREAVRLALRTLLNEGGPAEEYDEYDEFSDLSAWQPRRGADGG